MVITARGKQLLEGHAGRIDGSVLEQFPEFVEFKTLAMSGPAQRDSSTDDCGGGGFADRVHRCPRG